MCKMVTVLARQSILMPREIFYGSKNIPRFYHNRQIFCQVDSWQLHKLVPLKMCQITRNVSSTTNTPVTPENFPKTLTKEQAKNVVSRLTTEERDVFSAAIDECKSDEVKARFEDELAPFNWRSKFGKPANMRLGDVDPTGSYCPVPDDWLQQKSAKNVTPLTPKQLIHVMLSNAIPFIGFGFLDNFVMIVAGDQIEMLLNRRFPISTMTAAALGNTVSDVIGIGSVHYVEMLIEKLGFRAPKLNPMQERLRSTRIATNLGRIFGVTLGCIIGMAPIPIISLFHRGG